MVAPEGDPELLPPACTENHDLGMANQWLEPERDWTAEAAAGEQEEFRDATWSTPEHGLNRSCGQLKGWEADFNPA
jgi:hypothetical protein